MLLAGETQTPMGRERALTLEPLTDMPAIGTTLAETGQGRLAVGAAGGPPWEVIPEVRATLERARTPGAICEAGELAALVPLLQASPRLRAYGRNIESVAPDLAGSLARLPPVRSLHDLLTRSLDEDGAVKDEASPALARLRRRLRDLRRAIVRTLEGYLQAAGSESTYQDRYVTTRHGRYVVPVRAEARARVRGIVHDRSQSGATLFVEPEKVVEANNELVQAAREEESEVLRVLEALTAALLEALPDVERLVEEIGRLDLIFARAALADRMEASEPVVEEERTVAVSGARHPLLLAQSWREPGRPVVPVDLHLDSERPLLVVTGPNAGGKTVALKTLGLLALMAQAGCHVPAKQGARLPAFSGIFAIIGDDQSVAENLSTFSAFVKQLREVLEHVDDRSLVLLDELGAGTDPDDGAALAQAVLEELAGRGVLCMASTHLEPLKGFAATHPRARNASVEFDAERLEPAFRLVYDRPGASYALAIGARLGLPSALIERARAHRSTQTRQLQELLARLDARDRQEAERAALIERREAETAGLLARARAELESARDTARETVARARAESQRLLSEIRRTVSEEWERLKRDERTRESLERSRRRLIEASRAVAGAEADRPPEAGGPARPGDRVEVAHLGLHGEVVAVDGQTATVRGGTVTVKLPLQGLRVVQRRGGTAPSPRPSPLKGEGGPRVSSPLRGEGQGEGGRGISTPEKSSVADELHLVGRTTKDARDLLEKYLDDAFLAGLPSVRIIHGKGTGALRRTVAELLESHPLVAEHRLGAPHEGGDGATVARLGTV